MDAIVKQWRSLPVIVRDGALGAVLLGISLAEIWAEESCLCRQEVAATLLLTAQSVVIAFRRLYPVAVWAASGLLVTVYGIADFSDPTLPYAALLAVYTVAAHTSFRDAVRAAVITAIAVAGGLAADPNADVLDWVTATLSVSTAWLAGNNVRTQRAYARELEDRAMRLEQERHEEARRAVEEERLRLARELHDVAAHHVSVISLHAEAGEALLADHPERAADSFRTISAAARATMTDLRRVVGVLRDDNGAVREAPLAPQPLLRDLPRLVREVEQAGLPVTLTLDGERRRLDDAMETSAYRIVQEALTNVLRHAGARRADVVVRYEPDALAIEVVDDGRGANTRGPTNGHGLIGMKERVALFGGSFTAAPRPEGGFAVSARLPL